MGPMTTTKMTKCIDGNEDMGVSYTIIRWFVFKSDPYVPISSDFLCFSLLYQWKRQNIARQQIYWNRLIHNNQLAQGHACIYEYENTSHDVLMMYDAVDGENRKKMNLVTLSQIGISSSSYFSKIRFIINKPDLWLQDYSRSHYHERGNSTGSVA